MCERERSFGKTVCVPGTLSELIQCGTVVCERQEDQLFNLIQQHKKENTFSKIVVTKNKIGDKQETL